MVWRGGGSVDHVHVVFSSAAARRLCLRAFGEQPLEAARTGITSLHGRFEFTPVIGMLDGCLEFANHPRLQLETGRRGSSGRPNSDTAQR